MTKDDSIYKKVGERLKMFIDYLGVEVEDLSAVSGLSEERLREIMECRGRKITLDEIADLQRKALVSADYLAGTSDFPFPIEPTEENRIKLANEIKEYLKQL